MSLSRCYTQTQYFRGPTKMCYFYTVSPMFPFFNVIKHHCYKRPNNLQHEHALAVKINIPRVNNIQYLKIPEALLRLEVCPMEK